MIHSCVILAAGRGSRLLLKDQSKPLHRIDEESLLERHFRLFSAHGVTTFWIVVGYLSEQVRQTVSRYTSEASYTIHFIENTEWERGNGVSVHTAKAHVTDAFYLVMGDHLFSGDAIRLFLSQNTGATSCVTLAVDVPGKHNCHIDVDDVTKVKLSGTHILRIGKHLTDYDVYDTGLFRCTPGLFEALEKSIASGDESLSGGISILSETKAVDTFAITPHFWCDIDTPEDAKSARNLLQQEYTKKASI